jgi:hypothetical protein
MKVETDHIFLLCMIELEEIEQKWHVTSYGVLLFS